MRHPRRLSSLRLAAGAVDRRAAGEAVLKELLRRNRRPAPSSRVETPDRGRTPMGSRIAARKMKRDDLGVLPTSGAALWALAPEHPWAIRRKMDRAATRTQHHLQSPRPRRLAARVLLNRKRHQRFGSRD